MRRSVAITLLSSALLALAGCKSPCRELSERLCDCVESFQRDSCIRSVAEEESRLEPTDEQLEVCEQRLETCLNTDDEVERQAICQRIETNEAEKQACGLSRQP
ncbi:hypothetical protein [Archangium sp.]|jgi:hypothetical protein|uniref:hypothetical protein n=1 Tax=Archangium sp. TaxID=1872627 RepID=UPI002ED7EE46